MIERLVLETRQSAFDVDLHDINLIANAAEHAGMVDFDAVAADPLGFAQITQQSAVAAAEVEYPLARRNPAGDDGKVETLALLRSLRTVHKEMFSR